MYKSFFGLCEHPFNINPDPRFLHRTPRIQETLDQLIYGVQNRKGLLLLTGEVGTGKTTLINHLLDWLRERQTPTAFIFNSHLKVNHLFDFILNDFGISTDFRLVSNMLLELNQWLIKRFRMGSTPVLIVDEAQGLSFELLEEIRLLLNLETASEKLLQIVLVGQPELEEKLRRPELRQLRQRIALRCYTSPLTLDEAHGYIADRLRIAGAAGAPVFESAAVEALHYYSRGIPRVINLLSEHALINAYVEGLNPVPPQMVEEAARDFLMEGFRPLGSCYGLTAHSSSNLSVMHSEFTRSSGRSFREEASGSLDSADIQRPPAAVGIVVEGREPSTSMCMVATVQEEGESAASAEDLGTSLSVLDLVPGPTEFGTQQVEIRPTSNPGAAQSDCATELAATMGRLLAAASSASGSQRKFSKGSSEYSPPLTHMQLPAIFRARGSGVSTKIRLSTRRAVAAARVVLRQWRVGFTHDWKVTANATNFSQMKKSLLRWFREPISSKRMASSKNQAV